MCKCVLRGRTKSRKAVNENKWLWNKIYISLMVRTYFSHHCHHHKVGKSEHKNDTFAVAYIRRTSYSWSLFYGQSSRSHYFTIHISCVLSSPTFPPPPLFYVWLNPEWSTSIWLWIIIFSLHHSSHYHLSSCLCVLLFCAKQSYWSSFSYSSLPPEKETTKNALMECKLMDHFGFWLPPLKGNVSYNFNLTFAVVFGTKIQSTKLKTDRAPP